MKKNPNQRKKFPLYAFPLGMAGASLGLAMIASVAWIAVMDLILVAYWARKAITNIEEEINKQK